MHVLCRIHENPLGDEGIDKLVSGLLAVHGADKRVTPDITDGLENENTTVGLNENEPQLKANSTIGDQSSQDNVALNTAVNGDGTSPKLGSGRDNPLALRSLEFGACGMTTDGACSVARLIRANVGITYLSLVGNKEIETDGWAEIADSLEHNTEITTLELHHNALKNISLSIIAQGLLQNTSVDSVDLEGNHIGDDGAEMIRKLLEGNRKLRSIHLRNGNQISEPLLADIESRVAERQHSSSAT